MYEKEIKDLDAELFEIYKDLHQNPERGFTEYRTSEIVSEYLKELGLEVKTGIALTGVTALLDSGKPGRTLMIRADMDCLAMDDASGLPYASQTPGLAHTCGHDAHTTMLLGAAKILSRHRDAFCGKILFLFQPNEEGYLEGTDMAKKLAEIGYVGRPGEAGIGGAGFMIQEGVLENVDACMALHVEPRLPLGKVLISKKEACASTDAFDIAIIGQGGHGSAPHQAIDPMPALAELIQALYLLPTRESSPTEHVVFHIGYAETPGSLWSAVAERVILQGGYRTFNEETRRLFARRVEEISKKIAEFNRCRLEYRRTTGYAPVINDERISSLVAESCRQVLGDENVHYSNLPVMGAEDFGEYARLRPSTIFWLGSGHCSNEPANHNPAAHVHRDVLPIGVSLHISNALTYLNRENID